MQTLLRTKLFIPPPPSEVIPRPHLMARLTNGLSGKLSLVSAPAGYGKTTLIASWLHQIAPERQVAWFSLDEGDNDVRRFFTYLVAALDQFNPAFSTANDAHLQELGSDTPTAPIVINLLNQLADDALPLLLILDDYHEIEEAAIHKALTFWLEHQPPNVHLVMTSRVEPPLPLARMRVRREVSEINADALRFTRAESADFLNQHMHLDLSISDIDKLDAITEGWVASLQLAALSLQNKDDPTDFIQKFKGDNRYIVDYLVSEVLHRQPGYVRDFLLQTSILERLNVQICNAVTKQVGSQHILETLDQTRLFVVPLDDRRHWYRYHHLFADCLQAELQRTMPEDVSTFHERASRWLSDNGHWGEAIRHAFAANNSRLAAEIIAVNARVMLWEQGETHRPWRWIQQLSEQELHSSPHLLITCAWLHIELFSAHAPRVGTLLDAAEALIHDSENSYTTSEIAEMKTEIALARANVERLRGNLAQAIDYCEQAATQIHAIDSPLLQTGTRHSLAVVQHQAGNIIESLKHSAAEFDMLEPNAPLDYAHHVSLAYRIDALRLSGQLHAAEREFQRIPSEQQTRQSIGMAMVAISWAEILRERNQLAQAVAHLTPALETLKPLRSMAVVVQAGAITLARTLQAQGKGDKALALLAETERDFDTDDTYYPSARVSAITALLHLQQGTLTLAKSWAEKSGLHVEDDPTYLLEVDHLVFARILIADVRSAEALLLLRKIEKAASESGRAARNIEVYILQALAHLALGKTERAVEQLGRAIDLAQSEGFVRIFVDEGQALILLLKQVAARGVMVDYIRVLLPLFDESLQPQTGALASDSVLVQEQTATTSKTDAANLLLNPLTDRELATLRYLATDLTIPEIAEQMIVAPSTIRTYVKRIYSKLDVHTRIEAVNRARSLTLLN